MTTTILGDGEELLRQNKAEEVPCKEMRFHVKTKALLCVNAQEPSMCVCAAEVVKICSLSLLRFLRHFHHRRWKSRIRKERDRNSKLRESRKETFEIKEKEGETTGEEVKWKRMRTRIKIPHPKRMNDTVTDSRSLQSKHCTHCSCCKDNDVCREESGGIDVC